MTSGLREEATKPTSGLFLTSSHALAWLDKCLPVLNGLIITRADNKRWLLQSSDASTDPPARKWLGGLWPFVLLFAVDVPDELALYAGVVLANLTAGPHPQLQAIVRVCHILCCLE